MQLVDMYRTIEGIKRQPSPYQCVNQPINIYAEQIVTKLCAVIPPRCLSMQMLKELGTVIALTRSGLCIVKVSNPKRIPPKLYVNVVDVHGNVLGKLIDIIGNVNQPYAVIKPQRGRSILIGQTVFLSHKSLSRKQR